MSSYNCLLTNEICKTPCISLFSVAITNYPALGKFKRKENVWFTVWVAGKFKSMMASLARAL